MTRGQAPPEKKKNNNNKRRSSQGRSSIGGQRRSGRRSASAIKEAAKEEVKKKTVELSNLSLILFEEVDVLFEERDKGFWSAIHTFISTTKRPILMTCTDNSRGIPDLHGSGRRDMLGIQPVPRDIVATHLQMIGAAEGIYLNRREVEKLVESCDGDVRKSTNILQFLLAKPDLKFTQQFRVPNSPDHMQLFAHDDATLNDYHVAECYRHLVDGKMERIHVGQLQPAPTNYPKEYPLAKESVIDQLKAYKKTTGELSFMDSLIGRKRQFVRDTPQITRVTLKEAGSVIHRQFSMHHTDLQNNLLEESDVSSPLEFPAQTNVSEFSRDLCHSMSVSVMNRFKYCEGIFFALSRFSQCDTDRRPPVETAAKLAHQEYSKRLVSTRATLEFDNAYEERSVAMDFVPFLKQVSLLEQKRSLNLNKRRFTHYLDSIDYEPLDNQWTEGKNEKYLLSRFEDM